MNDVFAAMDEEPEAAAADLDLTPKGPCTNLFGCCLPKSIKEEEKEKGTQAEESFAKEAIETETREFDLPELDDKDESEAVQPQHVNLIVSFWNIILAFVFFNWLEERKKAQKSIHNAPETTPAEKTDSS